MTSEFLAFAATCEQIRSTRSKLAKIGFLSNYFASLESDQDLDISSTFLSGRIFAPGIGDAKVGYSLIWRTCIGLYGLDDSDLSKYYMKHGDLGSSVEEILCTLQVARSHFLFEPSTLKLHEVYMAFKELAGSTGKKSTQKKQQILATLLASARAPLEAKYLVKLLTGEMRIGLVEGLVEESIAKSFGKTLLQVRDANLVSGSIGQVAILARHDRLHEAKITPSRPTNFMLAESAADSQSLFERFRSNPMLAEYKYDGIRAQAHLAKGEAYIFSRNLEDITRFFPEIEDELLKLNDDLIIDGEIVPWRDENPLSFQLLQKRLRKIERSESDVPVIYFAFDLLYCNKSMILSPLEERVEVLRSLPFGGAISFSEKRPVNSSREIQAAFEESKEKGFEGLVVKDPSSMYAPGKRGANWVKLKKELDTLDVVIVAAEYGHGKRAGVISDYTFAVRSGEDLKVIGKAYSGLSDVEINDMTSKLKEITLKDQGPRRLVTPKIVLEVAFDAIQESNRHDSGYALRFPRIKRIRDDKSLRDIDSIETVERIFASQAHYSRAMSATA
ncbi:MAG: ATP-dependent DNA ligase [Nitrososphaerales archaeon]